MNRSSRRAAPDLRQLRGRLAAAADANTSPASPRWRQRPPYAHGVTTIVRVVSRDPCPELHPGWLRLYRRFPGLFRVLDRPSRWLGVVVVLLLLSTLLGSALFGRQG